MIIKTKIATYNIVKISNIDFKEEEHPRDKSGQFTSKGAGGGTSTEKVKTEKATEKSFSMVNPSKFKGSIIKSKESLPESIRWRVDVHKDYSGIKKLYTSAGGSTVAVENDGTKLDAFDGIYDFYTKQGFEPISWCEFDENYAPDGWQKGRDNPENVVFFRYTGKIHTESKSDFFKRVKASKDYDSAMAERDKQTGGK